MSILKDSIDKKIKKESLPKEEVKKNVGGRPPIYNEKLANEICKTISCSTKGLPTLCEMNPGWPPFRTIWDWIQDDYKGFSQLYAKAKESQADYLVDDILRIIDKPEKYIDENGFERNDTQMIRIKVDALKWQAMKLRPKRWDKAPLDISNPNETLNKIREMVLDLNVKDESEF